MHNIDELWEQAKELILRVNAHVDEDIDILTQMLETETNYDALIVPLYRSIEDRVELMHFLARKDVSHALVASRYLKGFMDDEELCQTKNESIQVHEQPKNVISFLDYSTKSGITSQAKT